MDGPLDNPRWERYCQERCAGRTQRQAMLAAYPQRARWKPDTVDQHACRLEADGRVKARIAALGRAAAERAVISRADVLAGMSEAFELSRANIVCRTERGNLDGAAVNGVTNLGRTLLDALPREEATPAAEPPADFGLLLAPPHLAPHRLIALDAGGEIFLTGGRLSAKSSAISLEIADGMLRHPDRSAYVTMARQKDMRESVYEQMLWAIRRLGALDRWAATVSPLQLRIPATGQVVTFRGCDRAEKSKAVKAPAGTYYAYQWFEECDQLDGIREIRTVEQSATRGPAGSPYFRFRSWNPPRSRDAWINRWAAEHEASGGRIHRSSYLDVPREWLPEQAVADAEALRLRDPESYRHEYLGEAVGWGAEVFPRAEVRPVEDAERRMIGIFRYGVDWGFAADPFCFVKIGYIPSTRTLYVLAEHSCHGSTNPETAEAVAGAMGAPRLDGEGEVVEDAEPYADVWCDSAEPKSIEDFRQAGIRAVAAPKQGAANIRNGVRWLQGRAAIVIDPACALAASEIPSYQYERTPDGEVTGRLPDAGNHSIDAIRYACTTLILDRRMV